MIELNEEENKKVQNLITLAETDWLKFQNEVNNLNFIELKKFKNFLLLATERCEKQIKELRTEKIAKKQATTEIEKLEKYIKLSGDIIPNLNFRISKTKSSIFCCGFFGLVIAGIGAATYFATCNGEPSIMISYSK